MLRDHINHGVRASVALALRHTPEIRGRWRVARSLNKWFPPLSQSFGTSWVRMRMGHEMLVDLRSNTEFPSYYLGDYDNAAIFAALRLLERNSVVLDVGANIGFWTVPLANHLRDSGRLHSFEPVPANFKRLVENIRRNNLDNTAHLHQFGLSDRNGISEISLWSDPGAETGNAAIVPNPAGLGFSERTNINIHRLDDIFNSLGADRVDLVKADIEGHEDKFLAGAAATIDRFRPILYVEINKPYFQVRGLDASTLFEEWLNRHRYRAAINSMEGWRFDTLWNCKALDNAFFFPIEVADICVRRISS